MHDDELFKLQENYTFGKVLEEKEYEKNFPYLKLCGRGTTTVIEEDPNSENMRNTFEFNNDTENNSNINNNNYNNKNSDIIYQEPEDIFVLYKEPQREKLLSYDF